MTRWQRFLAWHSLVLLMGCGPGFVGPSRTASAFERMSGTSTVRLDVVPELAHAYVRDEVTRAIVAVCTGSCTVNVLPGRYRVAAGVRHSQLAEYQEDILVEPGRALHLQIRVGERLSRRTFAKLTYLIPIPALVAGLTLGTADELLDQPRFAPVPAALVLGSLGASLVLIGVAVATMHPTIEVRQ